MTTAVHGKASLAELLSADDASAETSTRDDRDKANTVDFGATLMSLIDPAVLQTNPVDSRTSSSSSSYPAHADGERTTDAAQAFDSNAAEEPTTFSHGAKDAVRAFDASTIEVESDVSQATTDSRATNVSKTTVSKTTVSKATRTLRPGSEAKPGTESRTHPTVKEVERRASKVGDDSFAALFDHRTSPIRRAEAATDASGLPQTDAHAITRADVADVAAGTPRDVRAGRPPEQPIEASLLARAGVAATIDSPVPDSDITLDFRKQPFSLQATDDAAATPSAQKKAPDNFAKVVNPAQVRADTDLKATSTPPTIDSPHMRASRASGGTSSALSAQNENSNSMNSSVPKIAQQIFANLIPGATASSAPQVSQTQMDALAQLTPQDQRTRSVNSKEPSSQLSDAASLANDPAHGANAQPVARTAEAAAIRLNPDVTPVREPSHSVNITVQLRGQTAQASVREHAGAVDVKILTPSAASAQRISSEMDGMRRNFDAAGIKLGHSEISYQQGDGGGQGREGYQPRAQNQSDNGKEVFIMNEVAR